MQYYTQKSQSGQVGIVILLITAVILTIAISLSQRTLQEQDIAIIQDQSTRVFNAAESGLEEALFNIGQGMTGQGTLDFDDLGIDVDFDADGVSVFDMNLSSGKSATIPLNQSNNDMQVRWWDSESTDCNSSNAPAAILVSIFQEDSVTHYGYDPCSNTRNNNLHSISQLASLDEGCNYRVTLPVFNDDVFVRVRSLYNNSKVNISSGAIELGQYEITSSAVNEVEDIVRTLNVQRSVDGPPAFMDFALVSGQGSLEKN